MREYERFSTACANAYVQPLIGALSRATSKPCCSDEGFACPLFLMLSGGGLTAVETAIRFPVRLVESGPAGGAIFAAEIARQCGLDKVLSYDMGGTTAKICLIDDLAAADQPRLRGRAHLPLQKGQRPAVAHPGHRDGRDRRRRRLDRAGRPAEADHRRAGQRRRRSGPRLLRPRRRGADRDRRRSAARPHRPGRVFRRPHGARPRRGRGGDAAARWPSRWAWRWSWRRSGSARSSTRTWPTPPASTRSRAARTRAAAPSSRLAARRRCTPRGMAEKLGLDRVLVPSNAGVGSAVGFLRAPIAYEIVRSQLAAARRVRRRGAPTRCSPRCARRPRRSCAAARPTRRWPRPARPLCAIAARATRSRCRCRCGPTAATTPQTLRAAFEDAYRRLYSRVIPGVEVEVLSWVLLLSAPPPPMRGTAAAGCALFPRARAPPPGLRPGSGRIRRASRSTSAAALRPGAQIPGPAIIVEDETSTVVTRLFDARSTPSAISS